MVAFYGVGDVLTTLWIFYDPTLVEANPFVRRMGPAWFLVGKILMVALGYALVRLSREIEEADYSFIPIWYNVFQAIAGVLLTFTTSIRSSRSDCAIARTPSSSSRLRSFVPSIPSAPFSARRSSSSRRPSALVFATRRRLPPRATGLGMPAGADPSQRKNRADR